MNAKQLAEHILRGVLGNALDELNDAGSGDYILQWAEGDFPDGELADLAADFGTEYPKLISQVMLDSQVPQCSILEYINRESGRNFIDGGDDSSIRLLEQWQTDNPSICPQDCVAAIKAAAQFAHHVGRAHGIGTMHAAVWRECWDTINIYAYG